MKSKQLLICMFVGGILLAGCSSKPGAGDVEEVIKKSWEKCNLVKPTNFKKINGVDHGDSYEIAVSYLLEYTRDIALEDYLVTDDFPSDHSLTSAALQRRDAFLEENCPQVQQLLPRPANHARGPLLKGETVEQTVQLMMVKSEKGWIIQ